MVKLFSSLPLVLYFGKLACYARDIWLMMDAKSAGNAEEKPVPAEALKEYEPVLDFIDDSKNLLMYLEDVIKCIPELADVIFFPPTKTTHTGDCKFIAIFCDFPIGYGPIGSEQQNSVYQYEYCFVGTISSNNDNNVSSTPKYNCSCSCNETNTARMEKSYRRVP